MVKMEEREASVGGERGRLKREKLYEEVKPYVYCIFSNFCFAGYNLISKISLDKGMSRYVLVAYGHAFGTLATALLAFLFERKNESKISVPILRNVFFLGLLGAVLGRTLFYAGLEQTSPAFASALGNLIPSMTFILAVLCRMEKLEICRLGSQAKILGTVVAFGGATLMTLYRGIPLISLHNQSSHQHATSSKPFLDRDSIKGSLILLVSYLSLSSFYILQTATVKIYPAPITLTSLTCLSGTFLSTIMTAILDHKASSWKLSWNITLLAPIYSGVMIFGVTVYVQTLVIRKKGPVFMTAFRPLATVIVAVMGLLILGDALYLGSVIGATLIFLGLYATLWGKEKEKGDKVSEQTVSEESIEIKHEK
ncbi:WAT1-related protein At5g07050-like [Corylus avellana]|uniref:WAT1-related protein At5g07050-like n=1 Tax=Corylus avellana TaxID=13451 RepID=UPI001E1FF59C|nr:WAT1-related protein At5g07050-like [Corylus avellana]XP_059452362.1 WAT1-related protein At5g07050-like [Corylus avellana]